jgi:NAD-dependent deacetylase
MTADSSELDAKLQEATTILRGAERVAILTGAGISAESGLPTFRDADGLWYGHRVEDVATPFAFARDAALVWRFYNARRGALRLARPNPGHLALVMLESQWGNGRFSLITQNVDGLHRLAGSRNVLELHGNLSRTRCTGCGAIEDRGTETLADLPHCASCQALLRPDVVWFQEPLPVDIWNQAESAVRDCNCFLVVGTSAIVYPAAGLMDIARDAGAVVIEVNKTKTAATKVAHISLQGPSGQLLPQLVKRL